MKRLVFFIILFLSAFSLADAQEADTLTSKVDSIGAEVKDLKDRVTELEKDKENRKAKIGNYKVRANWLALEKGMTKDQVIELLGKPGVILKGFGAFWYYPDSFGGKVEFDDNEKVSGWSEP